MLGGPTLAILPPSDSTRGDHEAAGVHRSARRRGDLAAGGARTGAGANLSPRDFVSLTAQRSANGCTVRRAAAVRLHRSGGQTLGNSDRGSARTSPNGGLRVSVDGNQVD